MNMMSNQFPPPQPELVQYLLPILRTEGLFFLNDSHFCICSSPPSLFLLLSSLLTLPLLPARPLQACCCSLLQRRAAWRHWRLERSLDWSRRGRKMGRRLGGEFCFFQRPSVFRSRLCQRVCVCMLCRFTAAAPLFPCNEFYATSGVRVQQGASAAVKTQEKIGYTPGCPLPVVHGCCHEHRCELSWTPGLGLCVYMCARLQRRSWLWDNIWWCRSSTPTWSAACGWSMCGAKCEDQRSSAPDDPVVAVTSLAAVRRQLHAAFQGSLWDFGRPWPVGTGQVVCRNIRMLSVISCMCLLIECAHTAWA